jgi:hypothetical protein
MNSKPKSLKVMHFNSQSIKNKKALLEHFLATNSIDVCSLNETWLSRKDEFRIRNFKSFRRDRPDNSGKGGVCLLVRQEIQAEEIPHQLSSEIIIVRLHKVTKNKDNLIIVSFYNPPQVHLAEAVLKFIFDLGPKVLLVGDLNAHSPTWLSESQNTSGRNLDEFLVDNHLVLLNNDSATYEPVHRPEYKAILDLAICSERISGDILDFQVTDDIQSDHLPLIVSLKSSLPSREPIKTKQVNKIDWDKFIIESISRCPKLGSLDSKEAIDLAAETITRSIQDSLKAVSTTKEVKIKSDQLLVLPPGIVKLIKEKRAALRRVKKYRQDEDKTRYNQLTAKVSKEIKKFKQLKWKNFCSSLNQFTPSDGKLWKHLNSIDVGNSNKPKPASLRRGVELISEPKETAEMFANHLEDVFKNQNDQSFNQSQLTIVNESISSMFTKNNEPINYTSPIEVGHIISKQIGARGAPGQDGITNKALKLLPEQYHYLLSEIFNASLRLSHIPNSWKRSVVVMIPKPMKDHTQASNHRPISLLNTLSKLLERVVLARFQHWLNINNLLPIEQSGFRRNRQTKDQILRLLQDGLAAFNKNQKLGSLFVDIAQAFDSVWHLGALFKMDRDGIPNYLGRWMADYLQNRGFIVKSGHAFSSERRIERGVPQGSVLGPSIFSHFFSDVVSSRSPSDPVMALFADDVAAWIASKSLKVIQIRLQKLLDHLQDWMSRWRMKLSVSKTVYTIFNNGNRLISQGIKLNYNNQALQQEKNFKFLGVTLDPGLRLHKFADELTSRAKRRLAIIRSIKGRNWGASKKLILTSYKVLIRSILEYVPFVHLVTADTNREKMERIQRAAVRVATHWPPGVTTKEMYQKVNLEMLKDRAFKLTDKYICKSYASNQLITNTVNSYRLAHKLIDGDHAKGKPRKTLLGLLKDNNQLKCNSILSSLA